jgi:pyruvate,water dikinase
LYEPVSNLPEGFRRDSTILVARSIDVGWVRTFGIVAGAVVETGGHLSHGSIVLREIGLPSVTNVAGATHAIKTGDRVVLNANRGIVIRDSH